MIPARYHLALAFVLIVMAALNIPNLTGQSPTVDEYAHVPAGYSYIEKWDFRLYSKNPPLIKIIFAVPLKFLNLIFPTEDWYSSPDIWGPWYFADSFNKLNLEKIKRIYAAARIVNIGLGLSLCLLVFVWASQLYGPRSGLAAAAFTATSPTILAHSGVATVDVGFTLFFLLALFTYMKCSEISTYNRVIAAGVALGAALLSKFSALILIPIYFVISAMLLIYIYFELKKPNNAPTTVPFRKHLLGEVVCLSAIFIVVILTINLSYIGNRGAASIKVDQMQNATSLEKLHIPLPRYFLRGLDFQLKDIMRGGEFPNYINGTFRRKGTPYYFFEALSLKETLPGLIFILTGLFISGYRSIKNRNAGRRRRIVPTWPFVHLPAAIFILAISFSGNLQLGVRYAMPVLPLAFIAASAMLVKPDQIRVAVKREKGRNLGVVVVDDPNTEKSKWTRRGPAFLIVFLFVWQCVEIARAAPHYLSYYNEIAGGVTGGPRYLIDSNVDWGQDLPALEKKMKDLGIDEIGLIYFGHANPSWYGIKWHLYQPGDRYAAVSVNFLYGSRYSLSYLAPWRDMPPMIGELRYRYLLEAAVSFKDAKPLAIAGGSIYIYDTMGGGVNN